MLMMSQDFLGFLDAKEFIFFVNEFKSGISFKNEMNLEMIKFWETWLWIENFHLKSQNIVMGRNNRNFWIPYFCWCLDRVFLYLIAMKFISFRWGIRNLILFHFFVIEGFFFFYYLFLILKILVCLCWCIC